jgi:hypothetical protein
MRGQNETKQNKTKHAPTHHRQHTILPCVLCSHAEKQKQKQKQKQPLGIYSYFTLHYSAVILSYPILSYPILSYPILSYPILSYPILSCPSLLQVFCKSSCLQVSIVFKSHKNTQELILHPFNPLCTVHTLRGQGTLSFSLFVLFTDLFTLHYSAVILSYPILSYPILPESSSSLLQVFMPSSVNCIQKPQKHTRTHPVSIQPIVYCTYPEGSGNSLFFSVCTIH